jgi:D-arginine dehydrogenase
VPDAVVIGGGIAGVSAAYELAVAGLDVVLVEKEPQLAHHTTGRSAATFLLSYGPPEVRALTAASVADYGEFPDRLGTPPLLSPRSAMWLAPPAQLTHLEAMLAEVDSLQRVSPEEAHAICPQLQAELLVAAAYEDDAAEIDVLGLHQGYVRGLIGAGGRVERSWPVRAITSRTGGGWCVEASGALVEADHVVLAAGAWCDELASLAEARPIGLRPLRRTIAICPTACAIDPGGPLVGDVDHTYYWRAEGPNVLCSPADETPSEPCDARPDELDVALALERVNATTTLGLRSVRTAWAGLRTFAPDRVPVIGPDPFVDGLWWFAGQGGYGIQMAPAAARTLAALVTDGDVAPDAAALDLRADAVAPARFTG